MPLCGDGALDDGEECDDGDLEDDDACNSSCKRERVVFVLSEKFQPDDIGGLGFADGICRQLAEKAGLPGFATYTAWLSDSTTAARERVFHGEGRYVRPDGVTVAESFAALLAGPLLAPIEIDENGALTMDSGVWTGTRADGTAVPGTTFCADWTAAIPSDISGYFGDSSETDSTWTYRTVANPTTCIATLPFYCFEGQ
jgi:cysteine-rich repeat protein